MKKMLLTLAAAGLALAASAGEPRNTAATAPVAPVINLLRNPRFETQDADWLPVGPTKLFYDAGDPKSGKFAMRIVADQPGVHGCCQRGIALQKGHTYRLTAAVRIAADFKGWVMVSLETPDKKEKTITTTNGQWASLEIPDIKVDQDCTADLLLCTIRDSRGVVWFDDVVLTDVTK